MKKTIINSKYILLLASLISIIACNDIDDVLADNNVEAAEILPELTPGSVDFSNYVALGASFTSGYTDGALFIAAQENSFPNILAQQFVNANGTDFTQPLMNDNTGGMIIPIPGQDDLPYRLIFNGEAPQRLDEFLMELGATAPEVTTNVTNSLAADGSIFKNVGVPGAKSTHIDFNGYAAFNPYFGRMATSSSVSMLEYAINQNPTFFTLSEIGGNDVLGYATTGGDGSDPLTLTATFDFLFNDMVTQLLATGAKGIVTNVPYITDLPHFTTIVYNQLDPNDDDIGPLLVPQIPTLNASLYGPLDAIFTGYGEPDRINILSTTEANPLLIFDENATDRSAEITGALTSTLGVEMATAFGFIFGKSRQATSNDLIVLSASSAIASIATDIPSPVNITGISYPMPDKWVLTPEEQEEIKTATDAYNSTIETIANTNDNLALVDLNAILTELASTGITFGDFTMNANLVTGGAVSLDGIHLTARGYSYMAYKFLEAIDTTFGSNFIESGNIPNPGDFPTNYSPTLQ
ncbi:MAG: G-D-S-L family lipolytic protein [Algibacter sp.]